VKYSWNQHTIKLNADGDITCNTHWTLQCNRMLKLLLHKSTTVTCMEYDYRRWFRLMIAFVGLFDATRDHTLHVTVLHTHFCPNHRLHQACIFNNVAVLILLIIWGKAVAVSPEDWEVMEATFGRGVIIVHPLNIWAFSRMLSRLSSEPDYPD
jgi:hypothetical protein